MYKVWSALVVFKLDGILGREIYEVNPPVESISEKIAINRGYGYLEREAIHLGAVETLECGCCCSSGNLKVISVFVS